ncbi:MAG: chromosomal replication initiator protein DnaA [Oscillospiraceae bacterium]|nr:chromosomal replication initiator protein DnaA [Oscillospiraceae bacterium]
MDEFHKLFKLVREQLRQNMSETIFDVWLADMTPVSFENGLATLALPEFKRKVTEQKFMQDLHSAFEAALGFSVEIRLVEPVEESVAYIPPEMQAQRPASQPPMRAVPTPRLPHGHEANTFDAFVIGGANKFAHAAALAVAANPGKCYNPLFIYGNSGLGKTHLLSAIYHEIAENFPRQRFIFTTGEAFTNDMIHHLTLKNMPEFHQKYRNADVLLVDDVQFIAGKEAIQEEFFHTFNAITQGGKQVVLTSDKPPKDMATLEDRLRSRLSAGLIADIQPPDLETRMAIVKRKASDISLELNDEIVDYIASQIKSNIRQLEGAVNKLEAFVTLRGMQLNMNTVKAATSDIISEERPLPVTIERVIEEAARVFNLSAADLRSRNRSAEISNGRQVAMYCISQITQLPTKAIGKEFSRDHSTVVYALREIRERVVREPGLRNQIDEIIKNVNER